MNRITVGSWRDDRNGPMQVVSGPIGKEHVRFEAPPAAKVAAEMDAFLTWFNRETENDWVVKAGLAHQWLVTIHPLDDGCASPKFCKSLTLTGVMLQARG